MFLCPECPGNIFAAGHDAAALVIKAQDGGNHVGATLRSFQCGGTFCLKTNPTSRRALSSRKTGCKNGGIPLSRHTAASTQRGVTLLREKAVTVAFSCDSGHEGLLLHPRLGSQRCGHIMQIPHLVPLVGSKGGDHAVPSGGHSAVDAKGGCLFSCQVSVVSVESNGASPAWRIRASRS